MEDEGGVGGVPVRNVRGVSSMVVRVNLVRLPSGKGLMEDV